MEAESRKERPSVNLVDIQPLTKKQERMSAKWSSYFQSKLNHIIQNGKSPPLRNECLDNSVKISSSKLLTADWRYAGVNLTPSMNRAKGANKKKDMIVIIEKRVMLSNDSYMKSNL